MNLYNYWLRLKGMYPAATADCVRFFQQQYRQEWREKFKEPNCILDYLNRRHIEIITNKRDDKIRLVLRAYEETTTTAFHYANREAALYDAIERAFRLLEQRALRRKAENRQSPPHQRNKIHGSISPTSLSEKVEMAKKEMGKA